MAHDYDYEQAYRDARDVLHLRGRQVGKPQRRHDGVRYCPLDGQPLTDREILTEAWGAELVAEIPENA
jgi:hypothetical protein